MCLILFLKIWQKENWKSKTMARQFFIFWICSNIFPNFSGCRRSILIFETVIRFVCPLAFYPYSKLFYCKNLRRYGNLACKDFVLNFVLNYLPFCKNYLNFICLVHFIFLQVWLFINCWGLLLLAVTAGHWKEEKKKEKTGKEVPVW